ncbi:hypothetical protein EV189_1966 [Motilibacter rhizosphaerae]|uniref:Glycosyl hydrolase family 25 n=1 Tax=Motilibacter rhizosphaerae TaxID=598652 RepID=A0A4Q7NUT0_9ACTN|nr:hypothetical protein [Motilibacter rhizosphaerae]RZS90182.1 hypothetical protein EV189_1966 [Motilibacter rhizosphaerae]
MTPPLRTLPRLLLPLLAAGLSLVPGAASAAAPGPAAPGATGVDVNAAQAGRALPARTYGVVSVTGLNFGTPNPDLARQLSWAAARPSALQLSVNVALVVGGAYWGKGGPRRCAAGASSPASTACAYDYGWTGAQAAVAWTRAAGLPRTREVQWWIDVESASSWVDESPALNRAAVQGVRDALRHSGAASSVGIYTLGSEWSTIVGAAPDLATLPVWANGGAGSSLAKARAVCSRTSPTGGPIVQGQSGGRDGSTALDVDAVCPVAVAAPGRLSRAGALALHGTVLPGTRVTLTVAQHGRRTRAYATTASALGTWRVTARGLSPRLAATVTIAHGRRVVAAAAG